MQMALRLTVLMLAGTASRRYVPGLGRAEPGSLQVCGSSEAEGKTTRQANTEGNQDNPLAEQLFNAYGAQGRLTRRISARASSGIAGS